MKTPRFWYPSPGDRIAPLIAAGLSPLSWAFQAGTAIRRLFASPYRSRIPVICVGNAVAGGAGKTPVALALARLLRGRGHQPVFVTRGYGGDASTVCVDSAVHTYEDVGDEALLLAQVAPTWVGRDRVAVLRQACSQGTVIIMDDGLQNPHIAPDLALLVADGEAGIGNGHIIPAGPLRESFAASAARSAALLIVGDDRHGLAGRVTIPIFHARLQPRIAAGFPGQGRFVAFAGIGRPEKFYATARSLGLDLAATRDFADHHVFTQDDIDALRLMAEEQGARLLTTEKDAMRWPVALRPEIVILPVDLAFDDSAAADALANLCISSCALRGQTLKP